MASLLAAVNGDPVPSRVEVVMTGGRRGIDAAAPGGSYPATNREAVFVISMTGHFVPNGFPGPGGPGQRGTILDIVADAKTLRVLAMSMPKKPTNVSALGRPFRLSWKSTAGLRAAMLSAARGARARTDSHAFAPANSPDCSQDCHGVAQWSPSSQNEGSAANINAQCLWVADASANLVTAELWQGTDNSNGTNFWIEAGMTYGRGVGARRGWFYERSSPVNGRGTFFPAGTVNLGQTYSFRIFYLGNPNNDPQWTIDAPWGSPIIYEEPLYGKWLQAGTEVNTVSNRDVGSITGLQYMDSSGAWHDGWPGASVMDLPTATPDTTTQWTGPGAIHWQSSC
jgi:hypothetical protein